MKSIRILASPLKHPYCEASPDFPETPTMTFASAPEDAMTVITTLAKITAYTVYYTVSFTISLLPVMILGGCILGTLGGMDWVPAPPELGYICVGATVVIHCLTVYSLVLLQLQRDIDDSISWPVLLVYSVGGQWSVALGLEISWMIVDRLAKVAWKILGLFGLDAESAWAGF